MTTVIDEKASRIADALERIDTWRSQTVAGVDEAFRPELARRHPPANSADIQALGEAIADVTDEAMPPDLVALLRLHDGERETNTEEQMLGDVLPTCPLGLRLLPTDAIRHDWEQRVESARRIESTDDDIVGHDPRLRWSASPPSLTSVPFAGATGLGYRFFVDLHPGPDGTIGQVIHDATEVDMVVLAPDLASFFERYADALEAGAFALVDADAIHPADGTLQGIFDRARADDPPHDSRVELTFDDLEEGQILHGVVDRIQGLRATVDLGGVHGSLHASNLGRDRVVMVNKVVSEGQRVRVEVLQLEPTRQDVQLRLVE